MEETVGVSEVGMTDTDASQVRAMVTEEQLRMHDSRLEERIKGAKLIVSGKILSISCAESQKEFPGIEEGVEWWEAEMFVRTVEKGIPPPQLSCYYSQGGEHEWTQVPKYQTDQEGVWLLRPIEEFEEHGDKKKKKSKSNKMDEDEDLIAYDPLDYQAISMLPRIQALIWRMGKK